MDQYTPRVGDMADPFTLNSMSPASAPTPSNREADFDANGTSSRCHHSADSSPSSRSSKGHARARHAPIDGRRAVDGRSDASIIKAILPTLARMDLVEIHRSAEYRLRELAQVYNTASRPHTRIEVAASDNILITPTLSPDASCNTSVSIDTPSPIRADRVGQEITNENAQGYYPAQACLHIGK